ncbi:unnamed protein product [Sympodiomycopsis kandeliae]
MASTATQSNNTSSTRSGGAQEVGSSQGAASKSSRIPAQNGFTSAGAGAGGSQIITGKSILNQRAALVSAYNELGKELSSNRLKAVGNYTLGRTIGEGTFGKVRIGTHRLTGVRVAIKQVPKSHSASLTREIHHHRRLHHSNVMRLYEVLATESNIWMISELCLGGELYDYLVERGVLPEPEARRIFGQLCLALAYIHSRGIVHRDLKLENVLLDERCNVKLGDFGFTREFEGKRLMETFCGTTGYAAPEMLAGKKYTGEEVDIWSLGIILYALLCGSLPFDDDDESVMKAKILKGEFELPPYLSEEARDLVSGILKLDPTQRLSIRGILAHPWFSKVMVATPMSTVEEGSMDTSYFPDQDDEANGLPAAEKTDEPENESQPLQASDSSLLGLGVDLGSHSQDDPSVKTPSVTAPSHDSVPCVSDSDSSDRQSYISTTTNPTSVEGSKLGESGTDAKREISSDDGLSIPSVDEDHSASTAVAAGSTEGDDHPASDDAPLSTRRSTLTAANVNDPKRIGMQHRNESQSTIRRNGSSGSEGVAGASTGSASASITGVGVSKGGRGNLPTHHESDGSGSASGQSSVSAEQHSDPAEADSPLQAFKEVVKSGDGHTSTTAYRGGHGGVSLVKRDSQNSSRGHHRTPSRTKRRSLSSSGLSDHHPPHLATRPVDYLGMLKQTQPALFSTTLEQNLLHQIGNLGMDVGQIVHSILTDACDASAAMWWLLKRKQEEKEETEKLLPLNLSSASSTVPLPALSSLNHQHGQQHQPPLSKPVAISGAAFAPPAPPLPPKDPMRAVSSSSSTYNSPASKPVNEVFTERSKRPSTDGLPVAAQQSFRRHLDRAAQHQHHPSIAQAFSLDSDTADRSRAASGAAIPSAHSITQDVRETSSKLAMKSEENLPVSHQVSADVLASPKSNKSRKGSAHPSTDVEATTGSSSPQSQASKTEKKGGGRASRVERGRANSLSLKLTNVLTGGSRKEVTNPSLLGSPSVTSPLATPAILREEVPLAAQHAAVERERARSPVLGLFTRKTSGPFSAAKGNVAVSSNSKKAAKESPPSIGVDGAVGEVSTPPDASAAPLLRAKVSAEQDKMSSSSSSSAWASGASPPSALLDSSPSKRSTRTTSSRDTHATSGSKSYSDQHGPSHIPNSNSVDTFSTISSLPSGSGLEATMAAGPSDAHGSRTKSSFLSTVRTWLGTEDKQPRRKSKKKAAVDGAKPGSAASHTGFHQDGSLVARTSSMRHRSAHSPYASAGSVSKRSHMREPSNRTLRAAGPAATASQSRKAAMVLGELPSSFASARPMSVRRQSAGSLTPTGTLYGERVGPSRAPSSSSLYRAPLVGSGLHGRAGSSSSSNSALPRMRRTGSGQQQHPNHTQHGLHGGSSASSNFGHGGSLRGLNGRRMSADAGTVVLRKRIPSQRKGRPDSLHSTSSRPASLYDVSVGHSKDESMLSVGEETVDADESVDDNLPRHHQQQHRSMLAGGSSNGHGTPRRGSIDSSQGRNSPVLHSVFVAHRNRSTYKGPSSNPALLHHHSSRRSSSLHGGASQSGSYQGDGVSPAAESFNPPTSASSYASEHTIRAPSTQGQSSVGTWRRSWGRPPPSWSGPVDSGPSRSELISMLSAATDQKSKLRDVFSDRDDDDWEDEDDEPTFSGGLGQLDSAGGDGGGGFAVGSGMVDGTSRFGSNTGWKASPTIGDSPMKGFNGNNGFSGGASMVRNNSGPGGLLGRGNANVEAVTGGSSSSSGAGNGTASSSATATSPSILSQSRYAGVRNAFQPPALGRDVAPRMIAVCEEEDDEEGDEKGEEGGEASGEPSQRATLGGDGALSMSPPLMTLPGANSRTPLNRGAHVPPTSFKSGIAEEEEEEEEE